MRKSIISYLLAFIFMGLIGACNQPNIIIKRNMEIKYNIFIYEGKLTVKGAAKMVADINHLSIKLYSDSNNLIKTSTLNPPFNNSGLTIDADGTYYITAEAFKSPDDSVSITQGEAPLLQGQTGPRKSSNTVTLTVSTLTYSAGTKLDVNIPLLDGTGGEIKTNITTALAPDTYKTELIRISDNQVVKTFDSASGKVKFSGVPDGTYIVRTVLYNVGESIMQPKISTNTVTISDNGDTMNFSDNGSILDLNIQGFICSLAGGGIGDNDLATLAPIVSYGLAVHSSGNFYIADDFGEIRKVDNNTKIITKMMTIANTRDVVVDNAENIYVTESFSGKVKKMDKNTGIITTIAGGGASNPGDGGLATDAVLTRPWGLAIDTLENIYIADSFSNKIRMVPKVTGTYFGQPMTANYIYTIAGNGGAGYNPIEDGGLATSAQLNSPQGLAVDSSGNIYIADSGNSRIRKVDKNTGIITTIAGGGGGPGYGDGGPATDAILSHPEGVTIDNSGNIYVADSWNHAIRKFIEGGNINTIAGTPGISGNTGDGGDPALAKLNYPMKVKVDNNNIYIADNGNYEIRKIDINQNIINTIAGNGTSEYYGEGVLAVDSGLNFPQGVAIDSNDNIYIADSWKNRVRKIVKSTGKIYTFAGTGTAGYNGDGGQATAAELNLPGDIEIDNNGNIYILDMGNNVIRMVDNTGIISTIAGTGIAGYNGDGILATLAQLDIKFSGGVYTPHMSIDKDGVIYVADANNQIIRKFTVGGNISTVAGIPTLWDSPVDGVLATSAKLGDPLGVTVDNAGNIYIAEKYNQVIRMVPKTNGTYFGQDMAADYIYTIAGNVNNECDNPAGDGNIATNASFCDPVDVAVDSNGDIYIADTNNCTVRKVFKSSGKITTIAGHQWEQISWPDGGIGDGNLASNSWVGDPRAMTIDKYGNIYLVSVNAGVRLRKIY